jgi:hypothetical protein
MSRGSATWLSLTVLPVALEMAAHCCPPRRGSGTWAGRRRYCPRSCSGRGASGDLGVIVAVGQHGVLGHDHILGIRVEQDALGPLVFHQVVGNPIPAAHCAAPITPVGHVVARAPGARIVRERKAPVGVDSVVEDLDVLHPVGGDPRVLVLVADLVVRELDVGLSERSTWLAGRTEQDVRVPVVYRSAVDDERTVRPRCDRAGRLWRGCNRSCWRYCPGPRPCFRRSHWAARAVGVPVHGVVRQSRPPVVLDPIIEDLNVLGVAADADPRMAVVVAHLALRKLDIRGGVDDQPGQRR